MSADVYAILPVHNSVLFPVLDAVVAAMENAPTSFAVPLKVEVKAGRQGPIPVTGNNLAQLLAVARASVWPPAES